MKTICLNFQVHQPIRLKKYRFFQINNDFFYYDEFQNKYLLNRISDRCYLPMNNLLLKLIEKYSGKFKVSFSITGTALDQFNLYRPDVIESFNKLSKTNCVEFLAETYNHSLSSLYDEEEFVAQVNKHRSTIKNLFDYDAKTFRNTEMIYSDEIGVKVFNLNFENMLTEGAKHILGWKSPNFVYVNSLEPQLKVLLRNFKLSDDIAFRFSNKQWSEWPLTAEKFVSWFKTIPENDEVINIFMDYETFGEHQNKETGIFDFFESFIHQIINTKKFNFSTPFEISKTHQPISPINVTHPISWADEERDLTAWIGNELQNDALYQIFKLKDDIYKLNDENLTKVWRNLQTSDHFYYMSTKWFSDGNVHMYFNPYGSPYEAYINYMNVLTDFSIRVKNMLNK